MLEHGAHIAGADLISVIEHTGARNGFRYE